MKVARFYAPGDLRIEQAPEPVAGPRELKLRVRNCSTCGTDLKILRHGHHHLDPPRVIGHEIAGEVVEAGAETDGFAPGDRVQIIAAIPCGDCAYCGRGWQTVCPNQRSMGYHFDGGFAEFLTVPEQVLRVDGVTHIPAGLGYDEASVAEPLACVLNGQELAGVGPGDVVVVFGAGPIGCLHTRLAMARDAEAVYLVELNRSRLELAAAVVKPDVALCPSDVDVVAAVLELTGGRGADVVITAAASRTAQEDALRLVARRGRVSFFGGLPKDDPVIGCDSNLVHYRELTIVGANGSTPAHNKQALELIASGAVGVHDLITHRVPLDGVLEAIHTVSTGEAIKVTVEP
ncbi:zinc-dependent dehydrogenase [Amycolatopsis nigrescens]|uniref:zinc-dependent dehydrogenase n=1 Tax=Amycolatopsis nigrescens TaxID=381445 RepID=UPI0003779667|nr:zinc-dependent dehydrogenase [Amycolatopsis nigrescens]